MSRSPDADSKTTLVARLSRDGTKMHCGKPRCRGTLAQVICGTGGGVNSLGTPGSRPLRRVDPLTPFGGTHTHNRCNVVLGPGWLPDEQDIWRLTRRAQHDYDEDLRLASGNSSVDLVVAERARQRLKSGTSIAFRRPSAEDQPVEGGGPRQVSHRVILPALARCPEPGCRAINRLDDALLSEATERFLARHSAQQ
jgi:hypothetical protein